MFDAVVESKSYLRIKWVKPENEFPDSNFLVFLMDSSEQLLLGRKHGLRNEFEVYSGSSVSDFWDKPENEIIGWAYVPLTKQ